MVRGTPPSQGASTHQIWNSYLKEYRRYASDTKRDRQTVRLLYASQSSFGGIMKTTLIHIINKDQTGFIKGRSIVENLRVIYDDMKFTEEQKIPGLIMLIDFDKAFDSLSWNFLHKCLTYLNFGESIRQWIKVFYKDIYLLLLFSQVNINLF